MKEKTDIRNGINRLSLIEKLQVNNNIGEWVPLIPPTTIIPKGVYITSNLADVIHATTYDLTDLNYNGNKFYKVNFPWLSDFVCIFKDMPIMYFRSSTSNPVELTLGWFE